ncbi:MAG: DNA translocase FtsK 4TM domain-containing protein [Phocaeicola sp.]
MAKTKSDKEKKSPSLKPNRISILFKSEVFQFVIGLLSVIFSIYLLLAFLSFLTTGADDQSLLYHASPGELLQTENGITNKTGSQGAVVSNFLINECFGLASFFIILFLAAMGMKLMKAYDFQLRKWFFSCSMLLLWFSVALSFILAPPFFDTFLYPGGLHGYNVSNWFISQIGSVGLALLLLTTAILYIVYVRRDSILFIRKMLKPNFSKLQKKNATQEVVTSESQIEHSESAYVEESNDTEEVDELTTYEEPIHNVIELEIEPREISPRARQKEPLVEPEMTIELPNEIEPAKPLSEEEAIESSTPEEDLKEVPFSIGDEATEEDRAYKGTLSTPYNPRMDLENYRFPTLNLLNEYKGDGPNIDIEEQNANKERIIKVLRSFGIEISSIKASVGPTITLYEITPAEGVRISKIRNLEDDIALSLSALGIRIIAPIPGKGTIGIEVPNAHPQIVAMHSILNSKKFQETTYELPVALGKTITNEVFMIDLAKAPHMLVAGATGQGKSVGLNAIVTSLLYKKHPAELKFVIIDPKKVEFSVYAPIERHFLAKLPDGEDAIITDVSKVVQTLNSLCIEMDTRYDLLRKAGCRNIKEYNAKFIGRQLNPEKGHKFMPYIVVIIDEFGDLIMTAGKEVELPICRIAQLARAIGIHAIIATQRPTTNIITGTIKANFPARVAFRVAAMMDSRTILDRSGAQQLIGKGDMLYLQGNDPVRVQCAFVDTPEVERISNYISKQQGYVSAFELPEYVGEESDNSLGDVDMNRLDPMFEDAARLVIIHQQGSTSLIQRKFSIGYNRAGRIMDQLEKAGIVGPTQGSKARDVLCMDETDLEMKLSNLK